MPWARLDDGFFTRSDVLRLSKDAKLLHLAGKAYAARELTDGWLGGPELRIIAAQVEIANWRPVVDELLASRLWQAGADDQYLMTDFLAENPSRLQVMAERTMAQTRRALYDDPELTRRIKERDADRCRYCSRLVRWADRKGPGGGTYDHVEPKGGNSFENIVVACRACNASKGSRTPEEAGMRLLPPPEPSTQRGSSRRSSRHLPAGSRKSANPHPYPVPYPSGDPVPDPTPGPGPLPSGDSGGEAAPSGGADAPDADADGGGEEHESTRDGVLDSALAARLGSVVGVFRDDDPGRSISRARHIWQGSRLPEAGFLPLLDEAATHTKHALSAGMIKRGEPGRRKAMPYFFAILEDLARERAGQMSLPEPAVVAMRSDASGKTPARRAGPAESAPARAAAAGGAS